LHMYTLDSPIRPDHFLFRDYLIAHPEVAAEYARLKLALADKHSDDRTSYSAGKRSFIREVIAKAAGEIE
ncbi:MAG: GrpB family protein, partial [Chloroflexota bacterium]|nr:GrpB family protein [Chloroflexota bacterium]